MALGRTRSWLPSGLRSRGILPLKKEGQGQGDDCGTGRGVVERTVMERKVTRKGRLSDKRRDDFVPGTPESRLAMVWPLTVEAVSLSKCYDAERRLQRDVTVLRRRGG